VAQLVKNYLKGAASVGQTLFQFASKYKIDLLGRAGSLIFFIVDTSSIVIM
jgi:hypothetical protein